MRRLALTLLTGILFITAALTMAQGTGLVVDFNDNSLAGWGGTADYDMAAVNNELRIDANKRSTWNSFTFSFAPLDISANPYVSLKVKTDTNFNLGFSVWDVNDNYAYPDQEYQEIVVTNHYIEYTFDFSTIEGVDLTQIKMLNFVCNPGGAMVYQGVVWFDDLKIGSEAQVAPYFTTIPKQFHYINAPQITVPFRGVADIKTGANPLTITASSSDPTLVPNPVVNYTSGAESGSLTYTPVANQSGLATISVTITGNSPDANISLFDVEIENNKAPLIDQADNFNAKQGVAAEILLTGIDDGNPNAEQNLEIVASSSNTTLIPTPQISYTAGATSALLKFTPAATASGPVEITLSLRDDGGLVNGGVDSSQMTFTVNVYDNVNNPPTLDDIANVSILEGAVEHIIALGGIGDGDADAVQNLVITATSSNQTLVPNPVAEYTQGDSVAELKYTPVAGITGNVTITVTVTDDGGTATNNGDESVTKTFNIQVRVKPTMGFADEFEDGVVAPEWPANWGDPGEDTHRCSEANGEMKIEIDKTRTGNKWAGLWYNIPQELDLTLYPYISITMKTSIPGTEMLIFLWDAFDHYNTGATVHQTVTGEYVEYFFDFTGLNLQGDGTIVDFSRIKALLINFDPGGSDPLFVGDFYFADFRVGELAHTIAKTPTVTLDAVPDQVVMKNAGEQSIHLTGISAGGSSVQPVTIEVQSSRKTVIPVPALGPIVDGKAILTYTPAAGKTGNSVITLTATASGSNNLSMRFKINVVDAEAATAADVVIDLNREFQVIDGFGTFMGSNNTPINKTHLALAKDLGMTLARYGVIDREFEPANENSDPYITDLNSYDKEALALENIKLLATNTSVVKNIYTMWSPPSWMKRNKSQSAEGWSTDNKLEPFYYEEYAEHMVALIKTVKNETGIELDAISLQNEPQFNEPYSSCQIDPNEMRDLIKIVGPRLEAEGLNTKIFWAEALPAQGMIGTYIHAVKNDPLAVKYGHIVAIHNYDADGINVGGAGADEWARIYEWAQEGETACPTWMTETSGHANTWDGALELAGNIYNALAFGNASAWAYWSFAVNKDSEVFGLVVDNKPTSKFYVSKQYYKYIRPGAIRVDALSTDADVPCIAFKHNQEKSLTLVLLNKSDDPKAVQIGGAGLPDLFDSYTTAENRNFTPGDRVARGGVVLLPASSITTLVGYYEGEVAVEEKDTVPMTFALYQNYPNPFNPTTTINFQLPITTNLSVKIYDILGREVRSLVDQTYAPGSYKLSWDGLDNSGNKVATGMYFYRLNSQEFTAVKKCILLK
ncbi:MAG TPA: FlgD immunoglobulin-like domain containing protein [bacterium]|nr:FlgD immunoglobulin-like domain containing protein [bacterium]HPN43562.1 FlgD immunoglobulin-like domain containing protein [bacterium]